jgi:hypothetical protein
VRGEPPYAAIASPGGNPTSCAHIALRKRHLYVMRAVVMHGCQRGDALAWSPEHLPTAAQAVTKGTAARLHLYARIAIASGGIWTTLRGTAKIDQSPR